MSIVTALYGHVSPETAYLVPDYPYGRTVRCRIRYWIENDKRKGYRFVSQTEHPGKLVWNAPRKSTYSLFAAAMYLDEKGYVQYQTIGAYTDAAEALAFVRAFPAADLRGLQVFALAKLAHTRLGAEGKIVWKIGGVAQPVTEADLERYRKDAAAWLEVVEAIRPLRASAAAE